MTRGALRSLGAFMVGATLVAGCAGSPQPAAAKVYRVGWLSGSTQAENAAPLDAFRRAMRDLGYVEGRNLTLEIRYADGYTDRLPALAAELVALKPDIVVTQLPSEILGLKQAATAIPIVMAGVPDPVEQGLIASLARPGGNITGAAYRFLGTTPQRLQLLKEAAPGTSRIGLVYEPANPGHIRFLQEARDAAAALAIELLPLGIVSPDDLASALAAALSWHADALFVAGGLVARSQLARLVDFAATNRLPSMFGGGRDFVDAGGLMFYGEARTDAVRRSAPYVDKILKGAKPADLPVEVSSKFDLIINLKTAKALGLTIPPSVLAQATELIQ